MSKYIFKKLKKIKIKIKKARATLFFL